MTAHILGFDTSCDETSIAVVDDGAVIRSNVVWSQDALHADFGGVVPEVASRQHVEAIVPVLDRALADAGLTLADIDAVAVTNAPGLIGALLVGLTAAKTVAWAADKPLVAVNHVEAHLYAPRLTDDPPPYPYLGLIASGGHTCLLHTPQPGEMTLLGSTKDDAAGEAFDKAAAILGLGFPGGKAIDETAQSGDAAAFDFPRTTLDRDSLDFSFSGLKTALLYAAKGNNARKRAPLKPGVSLPDLAASFQEAVVDTLVEKLERAIDRTDVGAIALGGGVAANSRLRARVAELAERSGLTAHIPPFKLCLDNAAMIAGLGYHHWRAGDLAELDLDADPTPIRR